MRKHDIITLLLLLLPLGSYAQDKVFNEAIKNGPDSHGIYHAVNTKKKNITAFEMESYVRQRGYIPIGGEDVNIRRFGDVSTILKEYIFTDNQHYLAYACWELGSSEYSGLRGKGCLFLPEKEMVYEKTKLSFISVAAGSIQRLNSYDDVLWSGNIVDGLIDGSGYGFLVSEGKYQLFKGSFSHGLPISEVSVATGKKTRKGPIEYVSNKKYEAINSHICAQNSDTKDTKLRKALKIYSRESYSEDAAKFERIYKNAVSLSKSNYESLVPDEYVGEFYSRYENADYDPQNLVSKARELYDIYATVQVIKMKFPEHYYGYNLWSILSFSKQWLSSREKSDREDLNSAIDVVNKGKANSQSDFKFFYTEAAKKLEAKMSEFNKKVSEDRAWYNKYAEGKRKESAELDKKLSKEIDWKRSKSPSGELRSHSTLFLVDGYDYEKNGELWNKNGSQRCEYNIWYDSRKEFDHVSVRYSTISSLNGKHFKSETELYNAFADAIR